MLLSIFIRSALFQVLGGWVFALVVRSDCNQIHDEEKRTFEVKLVEKTKDANMLMNKVRSGMKRLDESPNARRFLEESLRFEAVEGKAKAVLRLIKAQHTNNVTPHEINDAILGFEACGGVVPAPIIVTSFLAKADACLQFSKYPDLCQLFASTSMEVVLLSLTSDSYHKSISPYALHH